MTKVEHIMLVGHCGPDTWMLKDAVERAVPGHVSVTPVSDEAALDQAGPTSLLLINRVLDGRFSTPQGVELIRRLAQREAPPLLMLVSNFDDAQAAAVRAGALPGFGKATARAAGTADRLRAALAGEPVEQFENP